MPITPAAAAAARADSYDKAEFDRQVAKIDAYLSTTQPTQPGGRWYYCVSAMHIALIDALARGYRAAGWDVRHDTDRDGASLVFAVMQPRDELRD